MQVMKDIDHFSCTQQTHSRLYLKSGRLYKYLQPASGFSTRSCVMDMPEDGGQSH